LEQKVVTPAAKQQAALHLQTVFDVSQRRACDALGVEPTMEYDPLARAVAPSCPENRYG
jgi:hypothetical protein